jgi:peptide/nickel transport system permease protein
MDQKHEASNIGDESREEKLGWRDYAWALATDPVTLLCCLFLVTLAISAFGADLLAPYDPIKLNLRERLLPPFSASATGFPHIMGTDELGRDMLSRLMHGARVSVSVGLLGALVSGFVGTALGIIAGYFRGLFEDVIMRAVDGMLALPSLLIALFVMFMLGGGFTNLILVFTLLHWMVYARMARGLTLSYREKAFVMAAQAVGCRDHRIMFRHLLPNMMSPLLVLFTLEVGILILSEASLSFLGFGIQPPDASWGLMIAQGRDHIRSAWWLVALPGLAIMLTALSLNLLAAWVRTITDPVQRWRWLKVKEVSVDPELVAADAGEKI